MTGNEHVDGLLPFHAANRLGDDDRRRVETHLASCEECRAQLEAARRLADLATPLPLQGLDHPHAQHLDDYARVTGELTPAQREWIEHHLRGCAACREAASVLERVADDPALSGEPGTSSPGHRAGGGETPGGGFWGLLGSTVLRPQLAAVYLALVALAVLWLGFGERGGGKAPAFALSPPVVLYPGDTFRGEAPEAPERVAVPLGDGTARVHLELQTDRDPDELQEAGALRLEIVAGNATVTSLPVDTAAFDDLGVTRLIVPAGTLAPGTDYDLRLVGDAADPLVVVPFRTE